MGKRLLVFALGALCLAGAITISVHVLARNALGTSVRDFAAACNDTGAAYMVTIEHSQLSLNDIHANKCDKLTITNADNTLRLIAFGHHDHHQPYDGVTEQVLAKGQTLSVMLNQTGVFTFHDHLHDEVQETFTVR